MVFSEIYEYWDAPTKRQFATVRQEMRNSGRASLPAIRESQGTVSNPALGPAK